MAQVTIYLPDDLRDRAKAAGLNISALARQAVKVELARRSGVTITMTGPGPVPPPTRCTEFRHTGPFERLGYMTRCQGCGQAVR